MNAPKPLRPSWSHFPIPGIASTSGRKGGGWEESLEASRRRPAARDRPRSQTPALRRRGLGGPRSPPPLTRCSGAPRLWGRAQERERPQAGRADGHSRRGAGRGLRGGRSGALGVAGVAGPRRDGAPEGWGHGGGAGSSAVSHLVWSGPCGVSLQDPEDWVGPGEMRDEPS